MNESKGGAKGTFNLKRNQQESGDLLPVMGTGPAGSQRDWPFNCGWDTSQGADGGHQLVSESVCREATPPHWGPEGPGRKSSG